jgi:fatty-acyl-CoA synthase
MSRGSAALSWVLRVLRRAPQQSVGFIRQLMSARARYALALESQALVRAVPPATTLLRATLRDEFCPWHWVEHWARERPNARALVDDSGELTWLQLSERARVLAATLATYGVVAGSSVVLFAENSPFLVTALLAIQRVGGLPVLLDAVSDAHWLEHAIKESSAGVVWVSGEGLLPSVPRVIDARVIVGDSAEVLLGADKRVSHETCRTSGAQNINNKRLPKGREPFALLLTSGTTGTPKVTRISNYRAVLSGYGMGHLCLGHSAGDTIYCALPLSHATALLTGLCVALVTGCALAVRAHFSSTSFWPDIANFRATSALYVGEIARRLLAAPESDCDRNHRLHVLYGTGMPLDVWHRLLSRFGVPRIVEFYGATELPLAMVNLSGAPGYMGRIALSELSPWQIARTDSHPNSAGQGMRHQFSVCGDDEPGELVFLDRHRTGDFVVRDAHGYIRYLDRQPGVFRQNGHNTSSRAVENLLQATVGVQAIGVTHVTLPLYDGHAGLLVAVPGPGFELRHIEAAYERLAKQQRPRFLRLTSELQLNRGLKFDAVAYQYAGIDPERVNDPLYVYGASGFMAIDSGIWRELQLGTFKF